MWLEGTNNNNWNKPAKDFVLFSSFLSMVKIIFVRLSESQRHLEICWHSQKASTSKRFHFLQTDFFISANVFICFRFYQLDIQWKLFYFVVEFQVVKISPFRINKNQWFHLNESFYRKLFSFSWTSGFLLMEHFDGNAFDSFLLLPS